MAGEAADVPPAAVAAAKRDNSATTAVSSAGVTVVAVPPPRKSNEDVAIGKPTTTSLPTTTTSTSTETMVAMASALTAAAAVATTTTRNNKPSDNESTTSSTTTATTRLTPNPTAYKLDLSVARSLADKLSSTEITAIVAIRDALTKKKKELAHLRHESGNLVAQLVDATDVKDILTSTVRELKMSLVKRDEDAVRVAWQTESNQEVISFLDERVRELESGVES